VSKHIRESDFAQDKRGHTNTRESEFSGFKWACLQQIHADPKTTAQELRLAFEISQRLNKKTRACFPSQEYLADRLRVDVRTIGRCVKGLVDRGHLWVRRRGRDHSAEYGFIVHDQTQASDQDPSWSDTGVRSKAQYDRTPVSDQEHMIGHPCHDDRTPVSDITQLTNPTHGALPARQCDTGRVDRVNGESPRVDRGAPLRGFPWKSPRVEILYWGGDVDLRERPEKLTTTTRVEDVQDLQWITPPNRPETWQERAARIGREMRAEGYR
jgi:hypothetical protein